MAKAKRKDDITIITKNKAEPYFLTENAPVSGVLFCDDSVVKGSKFVSKLFVMPGPANNNMVWASEGMTPHKHDFGELMYFSGSGAPPEDIKANRDLGGEIEIWLGDEKHIMTKNSYIFIPKGLMHGPIIYRKMTKPILEIRFADTPKYTRYMIEGQTVEGKEAVDRAKSKYGVLIYDNVLDRDAYIYEQYGGDDTLATNYMIPDTVKDCLYSDATTFLPNPPKDDGIVFAWDSPHDHMAGMEYFLLLGLNA
jgi:hypothetical protein